MIKFNYFLCFLVLNFLINNFSIAQVLPIFFNNEYESYRINQIFNSEARNNSFLIRPIKVDSSDFSDDSVIQFFDSLKLRDSSNKKTIKVLPIYVSSRFSPELPLQSTDNYLPLSGIQFFSSFGGFLRFGKFEAQINPEFIFAGNKFFFSGSPKSNFTEYFERYGEKPVNSVLLGQSYLNFNLGGFSLGISNQNIWWGPGQWNSLTFSNNAFGFKHLTIKTNKPVSSFLGFFESQLILGRLDGSGFPSFVGEYLIDDWRYLNGIIFSFNPRFSKNLYFGASRTFQQYNSFRSNSFIDIFPIFNAFQKVKYGFDRDQEGRSQQATFFARIVVPKANSEIYFEYGRRDHAINWREAILNPEHARAYLLGFKSGVLHRRNSIFVISGEILHQQESVNILVRYPDIGGGSNWGGHSPIFHGWTNRGQMINTGFGPGSNVQTLDFLLIKGVQRLGLRFDRVNRYQDFFTKNYSQTLGSMRWVDFRFSPYISYSFDRFSLSSNGTLMNSINYQWQLNANSTPDFPLRNNFFSFHLQMSLIYSLRKNKNNIDL